MLGVEHDHFDYSKPLLVNQPMFFEVVDDDADGGWCNTCSTGQVTEAEGLSGMFE